MCFQASSVVSTEQRLIAAGGSLIELLAALVIAYHVVWALAAIVRRRGSDVARIRIAQGVITALGFSVAGTLLKTIALQTWPQIRVFTFVFVLRTLLKRVFLWEENSIKARISRAGSIAGLKRSSQPLGLRRDRRAAS